MREHFKQFIAQHWLLAEPWHFHFHRLPLLVFAILLASGVWLGGRLPMARPEWLMIVAGLLGLAAIFLLRRSYRGWSNTCTLPAVLLFGVYFGSVSSPPTSDSLSGIATSEWQPCAMRVQILSASVWQPNLNYRPGDAQSQPWMTHWKVKCEAIRDREQWRSTAALSSLSTAGRIEQFLPGDTLEVYGHFRKIAPSVNPGGIDFAALARLEHRFVAVRVESEAQLKLLKSEWGPLSLARLRGLVIRAVDKSLSSWVSCGQAPLAAALVFGQRQQVDWEDQQELMATGTLHMLSISGLHIEIVAAVVFAMCVFAGAGHCTTFFLLSTITWSYAGLSGAEPPVVRAAVQVTIFAFARWIGGKTRIGNLLGAAAIVVVLLRASNLTNVGVQLSFLAVATIGFFISTSRQRARRDRLQSVIDETRPVWTLWFKWVLGKVLELTYLSAWITLFTCPLIWTNFHVISPIAVPLNVIISLPLTISLLSGLCAGLLGWIPPIAWLSGQICGASLYFITSVVALGDRIAIGHAWLPAPPMWWIVTFYVIAFIWLFVLGRERLWGLGLVLVCWVVMGAAPSMTGPRGRFAQLPSFYKVDSASPELRCTFLSVGHGTCVMIEHPSGEVWLYDAGRLGAAERSHQDIAASLWNLKTARIERLFISHADSDHYNAVLGLLKRFTVGEIVSTPQFWANSDPDIRKVVQQFEHFSCEHASWVYPDAVQCGDVQLKVLHPTAAWRGATDNADSLCLLIEYARKRLLLPGDLEGGGLTQLMTLPPRPCHVVMAPHHGSMSHDPTNLLQWCQPQVVVISGGPRAARAEVVERYSHIPSVLGITHRDGAVQVRIENNGSLSSWRWSSEQWEPMTAQ